MSNIKNLGGNTNINSYMERLKDFRHDLMQTDLRVNQWHKIDHHLNEAIKQFQLEINLDQAEVNKRRDEIADFENVISNNI